ncbi:Wadjet anti-phage system protein JetD domain-containing protein [Paraglaciecola sp. L3A3]|uniref:DUF7281 domain-containing protein n=1 Tax=Paraglaciecola sp. L3A3 TaxID=2686358 RepID=UPI00131CD7CB|nr:Wadjet anti-phage system protein JetD domain-containing protein [Paraglaciecola sp. L3A3]
MLDDLSLRAKSLLASQYEKLLADPCSVVKPSAALTEILIWCEDLEFKPGQWLKANKSYQFDRQYIADINQILVEDKFASIFDNFSKDNHQSAAQRNPNEKQAKIKPTHHFILSAVIAKSILNSVTQELYSVSQINMELDLEKLPLDHFDSLVVIENRDSFNDWYKFSAYAGLANELVVYRGDRYHSTACKTLLKTWREKYKDKAVIYFGDFDLAGLRIAISGGYSHLLLPDSTWLSEHLIKQHYPEEQDKYLARLKLECPQGWRSLLGMMSEKRAGLRQQKMYNTQLTLYKAIF